MKTNEGVTSIVSPGEYGRYGRKLVPGQVEGFGPWAAWIGKFRSVEFERELAVDQNRLSATWIAVSRNVGT